MDLTNKPSKITIIKEVPRETKGLILAASKRMSPPQAFEDWAVDVLTAASSMAQAEGFRVTQSDGKTCLVGGGFSIEVVTPAAEAITFANYLNARLAMFGKS